MVIEGEEGVREKEELIFQTEKMFYAKTVAQGSQEGET